MSYKTVLTPENRIEIMKLKGKHTQVNVGAMFGVSRTTVAYIQNPERYERMKEYKKIFNLVKNKKCKRK